MEEAKSYSPGTMQILMLSFVMTSAMARWLHQNAFVHVIIFSTNHFSYVRI